MRSAGKHESFHVLVARISDGHFLLENLSSRFNCKFASSDSTPEELNQIAAEWCYGKLDVLISTTMGLVGNENPSCRHLVCVGYLYDLMQIVQFLGRLRNSMRKEFGKVMFVVPNSVSNKRIMDDNLRHTISSHRLRKHGLSVSQFLVCWDAWLCR